MTKEQGDTPPPTKASTGKAPTGKASTAQGSAAKRSVAKSTGPRRSAAGSTSPGGSQATVASPPLLMTRPVDPRRIPVYLGLFVLGVLTGLAGALVDGLLQPLGPLLALLAAGGLFYGGTYALGTRLGAAVPGLGWLLAVLVSASGRTEGDVLVGGGTGASVFLIGGIVLAVICATMPKLAAPAEGAVRPGK
ncbi:DUF6113 family protein [Streptomyces sp. NBC_00237]|uniref:DUF6113 family protein n=1 Tax=Streptomyces sp. NBC_00237 TaxID=2975687 RepID=UPI00224D953E|nr:DUF6113 family protein [Streptomyces sp. NBC_00237]MCX5204426.1 DUF6113 family protein [Streptomyces sp. NBC_00237]